MLSVYTSIGSRELYCLFLLISLVLLGLFDSCLELVFFVLDLFFLRNFSFTSIGLDYSDSHILFKYNLIKQVPTE